MTKSLAEQLSLLPGDEREAMLEDLDPESIQWDADFWLRPEQSPPEDDWSVFLALAGRGWGKAAANDTPVPTPSGWTTMGALEEGDLVFDEAGKPTRVLAVYKPDPDRMYRLTFSDGAKLVVCNEHQWTTWDARALKSYGRTGDRVRLTGHGAGFPDRWHDWDRTDRWGNSVGSGPKVRTTDEIVATFRHGKRGDLNHFIPVTRPVQYPARSLPIDPYLYGAWLGDGDSREGFICSGIEDYADMEQLIKETGYEIGAVYSYGERRIKTFRIVGFKARLAAAGLLTKETVGKAYLESSVDQRLAFLAGLLDTDGCAAGNGIVNFSSCQEAISRAVFELAASLGEKPTWAQKPRHLYGVRKKDAYEVRFRPKHNYFRLPRKSAKFVPTGAQALRNHHRAIKAFEEVPVVPSTCITVDSPSSMFLIGESFIPTHNSRAATEWLRKKARITKYGQLRMSITARTAADARDVVVEGDSGILAISPPSERPEYFPSKRKLVWPNGNTCLLFTSEEPSTLRGPQFHYSVADEFAAWRQIPDEVGMTAWANLRLATRLGANPQIFVATTPKRVQSLKDLLKESETNKKILIRKGATTDNASNLSTGYMEGVFGVWEGTKLGRQELYGEMLDDVEGALFQADTIDDFRANMIPVGTPLKIVGVDPTVAEHPGDDCGIVVMAATADRDLYKRQAWVLEDATIHGSPEVWARRAVETARKWGAPIVAEKNQGGAMIRNAIQAIDPTIPVFEVWSKQGKALRAEPVALIYEQGRIHHLGYFAELEDQMTTWEPEIRRGKSPDRLDALVLAATALMVLPPKGFGGGVLSARVPKGKLPPTRMSGAAARSGGRRAAVYGVDLKRR